MKSINHFRLIKPEQAARMLGVTERSVYRYCKQGLKHYRFGNQYRFTISDIIEFRNKKT